MQLVSLPHSEGVLDRLTGLTLLIVCGHEGRFAAAVICSALRLAS